VNIWGFPAQKNSKNCQLFRPIRANPLPDVGEIRRVYVGKWSTEVVNIWCNLAGKLGIYRQKTAMGHFPPKFSESPGFKTTGPIEKSRGTKMVGTSSIFMQSLVEIHCHSARQHEKKIGSFCFCLFVCLSRSGS